MNELLPSGTHFIYWRKIHTMSRGMDAKALKKLIKVHEPMGRKCVPRVSNSAFSWPGGWVRYYPFRCPVVPLSPCPVVPLAVPVGGQRAAAWRTFVAGLIQCVLCVHVAKCEKSNQVARSKGQWWRPKFCILNYVRVEVVQ